MFTKFPLILESLILLIFLLSFHQIDWGTYMYEKDLQVMVESVHTVMDWYLRSEIYHDEV